MEILVHMVKYFFMPIVKKSMSNSTRRAGEMFLVISANMVIMLVILTVLTTSAVNVKTNNQRGFVMEVNIKNDQMELSLNGKPLVLENDEVVINEDGNHITIGLESEWLQSFLHTNKNVKVTIEIV